MRALCAEGRLAVHVIIAGCGRVGSQLATALDHGGHDVVIIDKNPHAFIRLDQDFSGKALRGVVFDREKLEEAGIRRAHAFVGVTSGDNSNIVSCRTARDRFAVERVVSRIYDPDRAVIFERFGITTIASSRWTSEAVLRVLLPSDERVEGGIGPGEGDVALITLTLPDGIRHLDATKLGTPGEAVLAAVTRGGATTVPVRGEVVQAGDQVHLAVNRDRLDLVRSRIKRLAREEA
jgi:trk system potassium uptake protein TrkA